MRPCAALASALLLSSTCLAWPSDWEAVKREIAPILKRQETSLTPTSGTQSDTAATLTATSTDGSSTDATTTGTDASSTTDSPTDSTDTDTSTRTGTDTTTGASKTPAPTASVTSGTNNTQTTFAATVPVGGISMVSPNPYTTEYYKIEDHVTLAWNYTSVSRLPTAVDILAVGATNSYTYTWGLNQSVATPTQTFVFDSEAFQSQAQSDGRALLLTQQYTLIVYDAAKDVSATPSPGYLGTANQFTFGMYLPQAYESEQDGWQCVTCSGAVGLAARQEVGVVLGVVGITVVSFTWFAGVAGLW